jgi:ATP-dependent exoDNAse (exonuclease V) beta subunit
MGHDIPPLLWCKSDEKPFGELGYVAVRFTSKLEQSYFAADYQREFTRSYLDNLNLLYVAFTRAEAGMIVLAPKPAPQKDDNTKIRHVGQLLYDSIFQSDELRKNYDEGADVFSVGQPEELADRLKHGVFNPVVLHHYPTFDWRKKLVIRREGSEFFMEEKTHQRQRINYGILLHRALSRIQYKNEVEEVLKKMNFEGVIMEDEVILLREKIGGMMNHPVIGHWFGKEWKVQTEAPVIIPGGRSGRLDRVIFKEVQQKGQSRKKAVIVDYKTGAKKAEDRKQVEEYARVLSQMGYVDVEAYLLYLEDLEIVLVVDKMNLSLF